VYDDWLSAVFRRRRWFASRDPPVVSSFFRRGSLPQVTHLYLFNTPSLFFRGLYVSLTISLKHLFCFVARVPSFAPALLTPACSVLPPAYCYCRTLSQGYLWPVRTPCKEGVAPPPCFFFFRRGFKRERNGSVCRSVSRDYFSLEFKASSGAETPVDIFRLVRFTTLPGL